MITRKNYKFNDADIALLNKLVEKYKTNTEADALRLAMSDALLPRIQFTQFNHLGTKEEIIKLAENLLKQYGNNNTI